MNNDIILALYQRAETVFSFKELALLFPQISALSLKNRLHYAVKVGKLLYLRRGIWAKSPYQIRELACKLYLPSYISLETVLAEQGIIFQVPPKITVVSYLTRELAVNQQTISFRKIKDLVLYNQSGLIRQTGYTIASAERAFLDALFLFKDYHFDHLAPLDWPKVKQLSSIYQSPILNKRLKDYA